MYATVRNKGQVTIPAVIREKLGIKPGDRLDFVMDGAEMKVKLGKTFLDFKGAVRNPRKLDFEQARAEAKLAVAKRVMEEME